MGKPSAQSNKLIIPKNKLNDQDFDKLVIDTSKLISNRGFIETVEPIIITSSQDSHLGSPCHLPDSYSRLQQPKRPMNAFMVWGQSIRRELHHRFSNVQNALLSKALGRVWRLLEPPDKEPFVRKANLIKANHKRDYPNYKYQPRRVQERRGKNNMLIGINLNHPVHHYSRQNNFSVEPNLPDDLTDQTGPSTRGFTYNQPVVLKKQKIASTKAVQCDATRVRVTPDSSYDNVQTFEYHPYPVDVSASNQMRTGEFRNQRTTTIVSCPSIVNHQEFSHQQQTAIYQPYQQLAYNQRQNYQYQQQPMTAYEIPMQQTGYLNDFGSSTTTNNNGLYYGGR